LIVTFEQLVVEAIKFAFAGGMAGLVLAIAEALYKRKIAIRDDRKQKTDESTAIAANAKTIADAAGNVVKLQDDQSDDLKQQIAQLRNELKETREREQSGWKAFQERMTDAESRLARAERRAGESEKQAHEFRQDVILLGERLARERAEYQNNINKLVLIIEAMYNRMVAAELNPEIDLDVLKRLYVVERVPA
jgi:gas vesicle protein